jgi:Uncharacterized protein conserved in bacteria
LPLARPAGMAPAMTKETSLRRRRAETAERWIAPVLSRLYGAWMAWVFRTTRWQRIGFEPWEQAIAEGRPFILAHWHARLSLCLYAFDWRQVPYTALSFKHPAARMMTDGLPRRGAEVILLRRRGGNTARLRAALVALRRGRLLGIAPDGPTGPARQAKPGVVDLASLSGVPVAPISFATGRARVLNTWDRFVLPLPYGRGVLAMGPPLTIPRGLTEAERADWQARVGAALDGVDAVCDGAVAGAD